MKARVKATGKIVDVIPYNKDGFAYIQDDGETVYEFQELEILDTPDYWTRLEHQYAGMVLLGLSTRGAYGKEEMIADYCYDIAHALVQKLKEKEERK